MQAKRRRKGEWTILGRPLWLQWCLSFFVSMVDVSLLSLILVCPFCHIYIPRYESALGRQILTLDALFRLTVIATLIRKFRCGSTNNQMCFLTITMTGQVAAILRAVIRLMKIFVTSGIESTAAAQRVIRYRINCSSRNV